MDNSLIAIAVAAIASIATYLGTARKLSGKVETSEASELWEESRSIRQDYQSRLASATERAAGLEIRVANLEERNTKLLKENINLQREVLKLQGRIQHLTNEVITLEVRLHGKKDLDV